MMPCYKRPEYTKRAKETIFSNTSVEFELFEHPGDNGLRNAVIDFYEYVQKKDYDIIGKIDNDCIVPKNWLEDLLYIFEFSDVEILSPDVFPSHAAHIYGKKVRDCIYMPSAIVGGLWFMKTTLIKDMEFERYDLRGLTGAIPLLKQIIYEKKPIIGWAPQIIVQDLGHWSGEHPECIKTKDHEDYYKEVGREVSWSKDKEKVNA